MKCFHLAALVAVCFLFSVDSIADVNPGSPYKEITVKEGGSIRGSVRLAGDPPKIGTMPITKDKSLCGSAIPSPRIRMGKGDRIANAFIFLQDIQEGKKVLVGGKQTLDQKKCEYIPHALIVPIGTELEIVNSDPILHNVHAYNDRVGGKSLFNIAQPVRGQRTRIKEKHFSQPGIVVATCDAGHPRMSATIMVADHPYYTLTDLQGNYLLENIPPGTYKVKMWHEGVAVTTNEMDHGTVKRYDYEGSYGVVKEVTVPPNGDVEINFELLLR